jgi:serine/threonine-protein kinase
VSAADPPVAVPEQAAIAAPPSAPTEAPSQPIVEQTVDSAAGQGNTGVLRINSRPWSRVYVDGRMLGSTPQMNIVLGAGRHTVTLVNPDFGLQRVLTVQIKPNETVTKIIELQE